MKSETQSNSFLDKLREKFPSCEESLILLPKVSDVFEQQPFLLKTLTHRSAIEEMGREKNTGFLICSNSDPSSGQFVGGACLFIPTPTLDCIWMIKLVHFCKSPASLTEMEKIFRPLLNQTAKIDEELASIARDQLLPLDFKIPLRLIFLMSSNAKKSDMERIEKFVGEESKQLKRFKIEVSFKAPQIRNTAQPRVDADDITGPINEEQKIILSLFILKRNRKINFTLRSKPSKGFNGASLTFDQVDKVLETFDMFLPGRADYLQSIPDLYKMNTSLLFKTDNVTGKLKSEAKSIQGEIMVFWSKVISKLDNPVGVLLGSYDQESFNSLFEESIFNLNFEIDWVYVGNQMILALEVGLSDSPDSPESTINNKLTQVLTKTVPTMHIILYAMLANFNKDEQSWISDHFWSYLRRTLKIVLYLPNVAFADMQEVLNKVRNADEMSKAVQELRSMLTTIPDQRLEFLELLLSENTLDENKKPKMYVITPELTLEQSQQRFEDIFWQEPLIDDQEYKRFSYISSLLTLSSLLMKQVSPQKSPDSTLDRSDNFFREDAKKYADKNKLPFLDIILSPQQHRILHEKENKRLYIVGEPGSGKTSLLLAKAKMAAEDERIKKILFLLPERKTELREFLKTFPSQPGNEKLKEKLVIASEYDLTGPDNKLNPKCLTYEQVHDSMVFVDELYTASVEEISNREMKYFTLFNEFITHVKFFWVTNVIAGQANYGKLRQRVYLPGFKLVSLSILFRNSHHISSFSTNFIRTRKFITETTAKVAGCFTSKQTEIPVKFYSSRDDVDFKKEMKFDPEFNCDRKAIIFASDTRFWEEKLQSCSDFITKFIFSTPSDDYFSVCYTGSECMSVVLIIDELPCEKQDHETYGLLNLALTRAQFEVFIFAKEGFRKRLEPFLRLNKPKDNEKIVSHAANQLPVDLRFLRDSMSQKESMELSVKLSQVAVLHSNEKLLQKVFEYMPKQTKLSLETIIRALDTSQPKKIRQLVIEREQRRLKALFRWASFAQLIVPRIYSITGTTTPSEFLHLMIVLGQTGIIDGLKEVIGSQVILTVSKCSGDFLFAACANGNSDIILWTLELLRECRDEDLVGMEMIKTYKLMRMYEMTLLTVLCYQNFGMAQSVQVILDNGFPNNLLLSEFQGRNVLHLAIWGKNLELVKVLLGCPDRRATFLGDSVKYEGTTAAEYAKSLGYTEIESQIASYSNLSSN